MANDLNLIVKLGADGSVLNSVLKDANGNLSKFGAAGKQAGDSVNKGMESARASSLQLGNALQSIKSSIVGIVSAAGIAGFSRKFIETADAVNTLNARIKLATKSTEEFTASKAEVIAIAQRTGQSLESIGTLYVKVADAMRQLGRTQKETLQFTEATAQAMRLSGASTEEAEAGITQLSQALASGVLRGDEFNSIMENSPRLSQAMADGLGVPRGALRAMAEEGKLTADVVTKSILSQKDALGGEFAQLPVTVGQAFTRLNNTFMMWVENVNNSTGITGKFATALNALAQHLNLVMSTAGMLAAITLPALALRAFPAVIGAVRSLYASVSLLYLKLNQPIGTVMPGAIESISKLQAASLVLMSAWSGWEIGAWARDNFEIVRLAGVSMASGLHVAFATLTGASKQEIQAIKDGYFEVFTAATDQAQQSQAAMVAASEAAIAKTKDQLKQEADAYKAMTSTIKANYDQRLSDLSANLQQQLALIDASGLNDTAKETAKTAAILAEHKERLAAIKVYQSEILGLIAQEEASRVASAKVSGETVQKINMDALNARRALLADILKDYQAHFADLNQQYTAHLAHVQQIEQAKRDAVAGVQSTLRDLARENMDAEEAYADKQKEIDELQSAARKALVEKDYTHAKEYAEKSIALAKTTANEVSNADGIVIEKREAVDKATSQVNESLILLKKSYDGQGEVAKNEATQTALAMKETGVNVDALKAAVQALDTTLASQHALTVKTNVDEVKDSILSLNGMNTASTHTITIKKVEANATGGLVGAGVGHYATGGPVASMVQKFATGGPVFRRPNWLKVPGSGNGDTEPAALEGGSFVVKKAASSYYGDGLMGKIARGVQQFATGGGVGIKPGDPVDIDRALKFFEWANNYINTYEWTFSSVYYDWMKTWPDGIMARIAAGDPAALSAIPDMIKEAQRHIIDIDRKAHPAFKKKLGAVPKYAMGGPAGTDTVPAMLTPGEWVVKKSAVAKYGLGFLDALNNMRIPRAALAGIGAPPVARFATGGLVGGATIPNPTLPAASSPTRTVRVELSSGNRTVNATIDSSDETRLLQLLEAARVRAA
ncbi:MAG: tape measure protein [Sulfuricella sp.]|nr:tape measure protein [Sulfuricella sp.]